MSSNTYPTLQLNSVLKTIASLFFIISISPVSAVQPMSESDLEVVSATTGSNILNIFGASQAGLKIEDSGTNETEASSVKLNTESFNEGEATKHIALNELRGIEEESFQTPKHTELVLPVESQSTLLKINEQTIGVASVFSTSSEINYKTANFNHVMRKIEDGGVAVTRDLQIDLLKLENLRGDQQFDDGRSAGSIYLSDWRSQGDTRMFISN